jgi:copper(I)-binding protein
MNRSLLYKTIISAALLVFLVSCGKPVTQFKMTGFKVVQPPSVSETTAGYGTIENIGKNTDTLISISSDSGHVMLHKTVISDGRAEMVHMMNIEIKPGEKLVLKPMSYHLMLGNLDDNIRNKTGDVTLYFEFKNSGKIEVKAPVRSLFED